MQNTGFENLLKKIDEFEKLYSILSERIVEFGDSTQNSFVSFNLLEQYKSQQKKVIHFLLVHKKELEKKYTKIQSQKSISQTDKTYIGVLEMTQKRLEYVLANFQKLHAKTLKLIKKLKVFQVQQIKSKKIFKDNTQIEYVKKTLKSTYEEIVKRNDFSVKYNITVKIDDSFEEKIESEDRIKGLTSSFDLLFSINNAFTHIEELEKTYNSLLKRLLKKDKDFYEEIFIENYFVDLLNKKAKLLYEISSKKDDFLTMKALKDFDRSISNYIEMLEGIDSMYDLVISLPELENYCEEYQGHIKEFFYAERSFIDFLKDLFPEAFHKKRQLTNGSITQRLGGLFVNKENFIRLSSSEKLDFYKEIESFGTKKIEKNIIYYKRIQEIISCYKYFDTISGYSFFAEYFYLQAYKLFEEKKDISDYHKRVKIIEKNLKILKKEFQTIIDKINNYTYKATHTLNGQTKTFKKLLKNRNIYKYADENGIEKLTSKFSKKFSTKRKSYQNAQYSSSSSSSSGSSWSSSSSGGYSSSSSSSSGGGYSSSGGSSW